MARTVPIIDQYSPYSHKAPLGPTDSTLAPTWVPPEARRRLDAYKVIAAYLTNTARNLLPDTADAAERREYGDAALLVSRTSAGAMGDTIQFVIDGADDDLDDTPELPPTPTEPAAGATDIEKRIHAARLARWDDQAAAIVDDWEARWNSHPSLVARQEWLRAWADDELLVVKIVEGDADTAGMGDGVYVLNWSSKDRRPTVDVYDPGFYFPVLTDQTRGYPDRVHLAWEFDRTTVDGKTVRFVRRLTFELAEILSAYLMDDGSDFVRDETGAVTFDEGDRYDPATGRVYRRYPWSQPSPSPDNGQPADGVESSITCLYTDATWELATLEKGVHADDFDPNRATYAFDDDGNQLRRRDMRIDFLPVVHVPNTPASREHFGRSVLDVVAQLLDDLSASDTDVQAASALAAGPVLGLSGGTTEEQEVRPGIVWNLGVDGKLTSLDMSAGLAELQKVNGGLQDRLSVNARVPAVVLGRVSPSSSTPLTGIGIALSFGPFRQLVELLRLTREPKYRLLLKFAQRLAQAGGVLEPGPNPVARVVFGSYLPSDLKEAVEVVVALLQAHGVSRRTALRMLQDAGVEIGDLTAEIDRIRAEDTAGAAEIGDALASEQAAADYLGVELPAAPAVPAAPTITIPGTPPPTPPTGANP